MPLETASFINQLDSANPLGSDPIASGDDHIRLIKAAVKATFPNITGAVTKTHAEINNLASQTDLTALSTSTTAAINAVAEYKVPSGGIIIWSGAANAIPSGWVLCNGANSTPDLRDRFVVGAGSSYAVGATGGSKDAIVVAHTHTATSTSSVSDPGHTHLIWGDGSSQTWAGAGGFQTMNKQWLEAWVSTEAASTGVSVSTTTAIASSGSSGTNANLPPYYALCYIMKV